MICCKFYCIRRLFYPDILLFQNTWLYLKEWHSWSSRASLIAVISALGWTRKQLLNCPPRFAQRPAADRHLVFDSHIQRQHSLKKRPHVLLIPLWMTFSTRAKQGIVQAKGWEAGELQKAAAPAQSPARLKRARRATVPQQENRQLSSKCPRSQGPS